MTDSNHAMRIAPSLLSANFARLGDEVTAVIEAGADLIHFDVMDNHYVPNLTIGPLVCEAIKPYATVPIDVHLMVKPVDAIIPMFAKAGAGIISFHPEASEHVDRTIQLIKSLGVKAGLVLNPATPLNVLDHVLDQLDLVLVMSVNPGFGGQSFIESALPKIEKLRRLIDASMARTGREIWLEVDGGVKPDNAARIGAAGADTLVAGSAVFSGGKYADAISAIRSRAIEGRAAPSPQPSPQRGEGVIQIFNIEESDMPTGGRWTLTQFIIEERRKRPEATGDLNALITDVSLACKAISRKVAYGVLANDAVTVDTNVNVQGEEQKPLDVLSNQMFLRANEWGGHVAGMVSEELEQAYTLPKQYPRGKYLLCFDPLDGSSNIDVNVTVGSIFSVLRANTPGSDPKPEDFLQPGTEQVCAGYAIYGPTTMLVLTVGTGTHAFTLDPLLGEWVLSHPNLKIAPKTREFAINASNSRFWEPAVKRYVDECLAGKTGPRGEDFNMRWIASLVAETHRILMRGGVFMYPKDTKDAGKPGRLRLLYEANPISMLIEQAGGKASTGRKRLMEVKPESLHQRIGFVFGSADEVARIETYHQQDDETPPKDTFRSPLFAERGLFAAMD